MDGNTAAQVLAALAAARTDSLERGSTLRTPDARQLSRQYFPAYLKHRKRDLFVICEELLNSRDDAARLIAFDWAFQVRALYEEGDFSRFERWLRDYVDGWGSCDDFCVHAFGALLYQFPQCSKRLRAWTSAANRWLRRASAVVLIYGVRRQTLFAEAFTIADLLLYDEDDLVQKGYGWLLKEVSNHEPQAVFDYVMRHKADMPRTSLRYAIEKLDPDRRRQAMAK